MVGEVLASSSLDGAVMGDSMKYTVDTITQNTTWKASFINACLTYAMS